MRTLLQHAWAELSEKLSDLVDPAIKYGGGNPQNQGLLTEYSGLIAEQESLESELPTVSNNLSALLAHDNLAQEEQDALLASQKRAEELQREVPLIRQQILAKLRTAIDKLPERKI